MASRPILVTASTTLILAAARNTVVRAFSLCAAAATSTLELFDGTIGSLATIAIGAAGTGYTAGDIVTLVTAGGGVAATVSVTTAPAGVPDAVALVSAGTGYVAASTYATTGGTGTGLTITASTITDAGVSIGKISVVANESKIQKICALTINGLSARISGSSAKGYIYQ